MNERGYLRFPGVRGDQVVFVSDDDLWTVPIEGGLARRLTAGLGDVSRPFISPEGEWIAFTGKEEGQLEAYVMPAEGGQPWRISWLSPSIANTVGWTADGQVLFSSNHAEPTRQPPHIYSLPIDASGTATRLPIGPARELSYGPGGRMVMARGNAIDTARWKRYRGGTVGTIWIDDSGDGQFRRLTPAGSSPDDIMNQANPMWIGDRIWFVADPEGVGNLYSCKPDGSDLQRHTDHGDYYVRSASTDGRRIVYQCAAELWQYDPATGTGGKIPVECRSPRTQLHKKFVDGSDHLDSYAVHPHGHSVAVTTRGKCAGMALWEEAPRQYGTRFGVRYRYAQWLHDGNALVVISDEGGEEAIEVYPQDPLAGRKRHDGLPIGRPIEMIASPTANAVVLCNQRFELIHVDLDAGTHKVLDKSEHNRIEGAAWSPDGKWVAYSYSSSRYTIHLRIVEVATGTTHDVTRADFRDYCPAWDPEGKFLYFLSYRTFDPVYDAVYFDLGFPRATKPYLITLQKDECSPFELKPKGFGEKKPDEAKDEKKDADDADDKKEDDKADDKADKADDKKAEPKPVQIDFDGISDRVIAIPAAEAKYAQIAGIKGGKVLLTSFPVEGALGGAFWTDPLPKGVLECIAFDEPEPKTLATAVGSFVVALDGATLVYRSGKRLRAIKAGEKAPDDGAPGRKSGWIDLTRIKLAIDPRKEWVQMYREAWRLMRDHFWVEDMSGIDWEAVFHRYHPSRLDPGTRLEFSDLMWEMQGELGTSHAYEMGGDHREPPPRIVGQLGADLRRDANGLWHVEQIMRGDCWDPARSSPLAAPGLNVAEGSTILAINGQPVSDVQPPGALLIYTAGSRVELTLGDADGKNPRRVIVRALSAEGPLRYREWVEANRAHVHQATGGRVGYLHVPDMGAAGYSEFHRYFQAEVTRGGLIVDVRFNGGGHVSQLLLEKLRRRALGYDTQRYGGLMTYPDMAVPGPIVCLTNEFAGSDGDIFSHAFKMYELGPLVGTRTWGGVIGIWPRHRLADGTVTTQPEFSFWFHDVGFRVENYGTDPHHVVEILPQDHAAGRDPQMAKALELVEQMLKEKPLTPPDLGPRPNLAPKPLEPRGPRQ
ncbi:MAG: PDZ domain-containing protein [Planctomycetota bacterium]